jgi:hypothetical protein
MKLVNGARPFVEDVFGKHGEAAPNSHINPTNSRFQLNLITNYQLPPTYSLPKKPSTITTQHLSVNCP